MKTLALQKVAILAATLAIGSMAIAGGALARTSAHASSHPHQAVQSPQATKKDDCSAWSWEVPIATSGMPASSMPCPRNGANPKG
jgi:hypothetical protein